ncbi:MAG: hypothetical protein JKY75_05470 [Erythrobacter sp.]|jgi:hypothetical protein|nr:hypothetical protein [Erythrobacter sp.]
MARIKLNFKIFFTKEAKKNIIGKPTTSYPTYASLLNSKRGINLDSAPRNKKSTIKTKGKDHWLVSTKETMKKGIKFGAQPLRLSVFASGKKHSGKYLYAGGSKRGKSKNPPTYRSLFRWHNQEHYSGIFNKLPRGSQFFKRLQKECDRQVERELKKQVKKFKRTVV